MSARGVMVAATRSGEGKTIVSCCLMAALSAAGLVVQPFKVGPDYIDPGFHAVVAGRNSYNLDLWMSDAEGISEIYDSASRGSDIAVVEGVMGLFDGAAGDLDTSSAEVAQLLGLPVILVVDVSRVGQSAAAIAFGFKKFRPSLNLAGVILNKVGSEKHLALLRKSFAGAEIDVLGALPRQEELSVPEMYLGLQPVTTVAGPDVEVLAGIGQRYLDLDAIKALQVARAQRAVPHPPGHVQARATIGVLRDESFCFYYQDTFDALRNAGAKLVFFSPISETTLPPELDGMYMGGGFPEAFGAELQANQSLRRAIKGVAAAGMPIYAECGGLLYLLEDIEVEGRRYEMVGVIPGRGCLTKKRQALGYLTAVTAGDSLVAAAGAEVRGHEFHWSSASITGPASAAYSSVESTGGARRQNEGYANGNIMASYVHLQLAQIDGACERLVNACAKYGEESRGRE